MQGMVGQDIDTKLGVGATNFFTDFFACLRQRCLQRLLPLNKPKQWSRWAIQRTA
jgi:hypothetical protein